MLVWCFIRFEVNQNVENSSSYLTRSIGNNSSREVHLPPILKLNFSKYPDFAVPFCRPASIP